MSGNPSWLDDAVKHAHVSLLHYIWIERMPTVLAYCGFSIENAWQTWAAFMENPKDPKLKGIKRAVNEEFARMIQLN